MDQTPRTLLKGMVGSDKDLGPPPMMAPPAGPPTTNGPPTGGPPTSGFSSMMTPKTVMKQAAAQMEPGSMLSGGMPKESIPPALTTPTTASAEPPKKTYVKRPIATTKKAGATRTSFESYLLFLNFFLSTGILLTLVGIVMLAMAIHYEKPMPVTQMKFESVKVLFELIQDYGSSAYNQTHSFATGVIDKYELHDHVNTCTAVTNGVYDATSQKLSQVGAMIDYPGLKVKTVELTDKLLVVYSKWYDNSRIYIAQQLDQFWR